MIAAADEPGGRIKGRRLLLVRKTADGTGTLGDGATKRAGDRASELAPGGQVLLDYA